MAAPLVVLSPDKSLMIDKDPDIDFLLMSDTLELAYGLTMPTSIYDWPRSPSYTRGEQPMPSGGRKVYFKTGSIEPAAGEDKQFWEAWASLFNYERNKAVVGEETGWNQFRNLLKLVAKVMVGFFIIAVVVFLAQRFGIGVG